MKLLAALAFLLAAVNAQAAEPAPADTASCRIWIASQPNRYDQKVLEFTVTADSQTNYVLIGKDTKTAQVISADTFAELKTNKFQAIDGQYVMLYLADTGGLVSIGFGKADAQTGSLINGVITYAQKSEETIVIPMGALFGTDCTPAAAK